LAGGTSWAPARGQIAKMSHKLVKTSEVFQLVLCCVGRPLGKASVTLDNLITTA